MGSFRLDRFLEFLTSVELVVGLLWVGLAIFTITVIVLMQTRWGQSQPLVKCLILSILAHLLLVGYATTIQIVSSAPPGEEPVVSVSFVEGPLREAVGREDPVSEEKPWEEFVHDNVTQPDPDAPDREPIEDVPEPERHEQTAPSNLPGQASLDHLAMADIEMPDPERPEIDDPAPQTRSARSAMQIEAPMAQRRDAPRMVFHDNAVPDRPAPAERPMRTVRRPSAGVPTALLDQPVPLPRMEATPTSSDPMTALTGLTDYLTKPRRMELAKAPARDINRSFPAPDMAYTAEGAGSGRHNEGTSDSVVALASGQHRAGQSEPGLPPAGDTSTDTSQPRENPSAAGSPQVPNLYQLRVAPDRAKLAERHGATPATEAAVKAALKWLASNQKADGSWDASVHGAGREHMVAGRNRSGAGIDADTAVTGLALLAFLGSGHTHREGPYRDNVRRGLEYLLRVQGYDGNLCGPATAYAKMYCHGMAAFAMSEAYGMSGDQRLRQPVVRAITYTLRAQDPNGGGFRYNPHDPGDTSQLGWQLMALKSAELAGIAIPVESRNGMIRYLRSVAVGQYGGKASYRPSEPVSRPMTAEALVCWQFLGIPREHPACNEAGDYLLGEVPGDGDPNLYYWYYGTLGMYQLGGEHWKRWNEAQRELLVDRQRSDGPLAGTWDPNTTWGGYGGRVYSTALATLCLEVYYRYLPIYVKVVAPAEKQ